MYSLLCKHVVLKLDIRNAYSTVNMCIHDHLLSNLKSSMGKARRFSPIFLLNRLSQEVFEGPALQQLNATL
jgi:hypothetical protein